MIIEAWNVFRKEYLKQLMASMKSRRVELIEKIGHSTSYWHFIWINNMIWNPYYSPNYRKFIDDEKRFKRLSLEIIINTQFIIGCIVKWKMSKMLSFNQVLLRNFI